jgi:hypothetical protein
MHTSRFLPFSIFLLSFGPPVDMIMINLVVFIHFPPANHHLSDIDGLLFVLDHLDSIPSPEE